jgi:hypothetical protein
MKKLIALLLLTGGISTYVKAQKDHEDKTDKIEAYKIAFITDKLHLTPKEASAFWPVYNEYSSKVSNLRKKEHERVKSFNQIVDITDAQAEGFIRDYLAYKEQHADLTERYITEFRKVLPLAKVAKLVTLEQEFKMQLLQKYKEKRGDTPHK